MSGYNATPKVFPAAEMLAIDMAEAFRALSTFNGRIEGCRLFLEDNALKMDPGRVVIGGRLFSFDLPVGETAITIDLPTMSSAGYRFICVICDLTDTNHPVKIDLLTQAQFEAKNTVETNKPYEFNTKSKSIALKWGRVKISTAGVASELDTSTSTYPDYVLKSNANYVDNLASIVDSRWNTFSVWMQRLEKVKHRTAFFRKNNIVANGITIPANSVATFQFRKEYGSKVYIKPDSGDATLPSPSEEAFVYIYPSGGIVPGTGHQGAGPTPSTTKTYYEGTTVVSSLYEEWQNYGVVGTRIENASSGGAQGNNCYVQSTYFATSGSAEYLYVVVKNTSSAQAKIKLTTTCLYIRNIDYPS